jgi:hypothetical protein
MFSRCCLLLLAADAALAQEATLGQIPVGLALVCADGSRMTYPAEDATERSQLAAERVIVKDGDTIHALLTARGIRPDVESFALVYEINPELETLDDLPSGGALTLPKFSPRTGVKQQIAAGCRAALTVDAKLKEEFDATVRSLPALAAKFRAGAADRPTSESVNNIVDTLEFIRLGILRRNGRPLSREAMEQLNAEASLLRSILLRPPATGGSLQVAAIERDIGVKKSRLVQIAAGAPPDAWPRVRVVVQTLRDGAPVPNLRVYYVPEALLGTRERLRSFDTLSTPTTRMLPEADYVVWASTEADAKPVSNEHRLEVRRGQDIRVDLTVRP